MFRSKPRIDISSTDTLLGEGSRFEGRLQSKASLRIEGEIIGDIDCEGDVAIGESARARSNITARNCIIAGTVHGNVTARSTLTLTATGRLFGNTQAASLIIAEGAVFEGSCKMESTCAPEEPAAPQPADAPRSLDGESAAQPV